MCTSSCYNVSNTLHVKFGLASAECSLDFKLLLNYSYVVTAWKCASGV